MSMAMGNPFLRDNGALTFLEPAISKEKRFNAFLYRYQRVAQVRVIVKFSEVSRFFHSFILEGSQKSV